MDSEAEEVKDNYKAMGDISSKEEKTIRRKNEKGTLMKLSWQQANDIFVSF